MLRNSEQPRKNSLTLLQEVTSDVKDSRSLPFVTKHSGTWKKASQLLTLLEGRGGGGVGVGVKGKTLLNYSYLDPDRAMMDTAKNCFLDWLRPVEHAGSCIIFHQHLVAFTGSALLWVFTS